MPARLPIELPPLETPTAGTFPTRSVQGRFGITAEVEGFDTVLAWQEQKAQPFQGYYRLIHHPILKDLLARLKARYRMAWAQPFVAPGAALKELLEFLDLKAPLRVENRAGEAVQAVLDLLPPALTAPEGGEARRRVRVVAGPAPADRDGAEVVVAWFATPPPSPESLAGADYAVLNLAPADAPASGAVAFLPSGAEGPEFHERSRRRGYTLSARDADWLLGGTPEFEPSPGVEQRLLGELCQWENAPGGVLHPTGMSSLVEVFDALCRPGRRRALVVGHLYSDTHLLLTDLAWPGGGFQTTFLQGHEAHRVRELLAREPFQMVFAETITNPLAEVPDLPLIAAACREHGVPFVVDGTMATPFNCRPLDWGADVVVHSTTKYFAGGNDHGGGFVAARDPALLETLRRRQRALGARLSPLDQEVLSRRLATFGQRMPRFNANGLAVARFLQAHPAVERVWYCGLDDSPFRAEAARLLKGGAGVVSCTLRAPGPDPMRRFYDTPTPAIRKAPSLGSDTTLFCPYVMLTYYKRDDAYLARYRLPRYLLRFAVGCEEDLGPVLADLDRALRAAVPGPG